MNSAASRSPVLPAPLLVGFGAYLSAVLGPLHTLAEPLISLPAPAGFGDPATPAGRARLGRSRTLSADLLESGPAVCARSYFLDYAVSRAAWDGKMPGDVLDLTVGVLGAANPAPSHHGRAISND